MHTAFPALLPISTNTHINSHSKLEAFQCCCLQLQILELTISPKSSLKYLCCYSNPITSLFEVIWLLMPGTWRNSILLGTSPPKNSSRGKLYARSQCTGSVRHPSADPMPAQPWQAAPTKSAQYTPSSKSRSSCRCCPLLSAAGRVRPCSRAGWDSGRAARRHTCTTTTPATQRFKPNCLQVFVQNLPKGTFPASQIWK